MPSKKVTITAHAGLTITRKYPKEISPIPPTLLNIRFDDVTTWLIAYEKYKENDVIRAVIYAFRSRNFLSQAKAAVLIGISSNTLNRWELGKAEIRLDSKRELIKNGWFQPQHFGMDISAEKFIADLKDMEAANNA